MSPVNGRFKKIDDIDKAISDLLENPRMLAMRLLLLERVADNVSVALQAAEPALACFEAWFRQNDEWALAELAEDALRKVTSL